MDDALRMRNTLWIISGVSFAIALYVVVTLVSQPHTETAAALFATSPWILIGTVGTGLASVIAAIENAHKHQLAALLRVSSLGQMQLDRAEGKSD